MNLDARDHHTRFVAFALDEQRYALSLDSVERILRVVQITPAPRLPAIVMGIINVQGRVVPVVNTRKRFGLPARAIALTDQLILAYTTKRTIALLVDEVLGVKEIEAESIVSASLIIPNMNYVEGVITLEDGMILIHDLNKFLSLEEEEALSNLKGEHVG